MALLLLVLMGFHLHGEIIHEWAGITFALLIMLHLYLNRRRLWSLPSTLPVGMLLINRTVNAVTLMVILTAIVSGMMLSRHIFLNLPFHTPDTWVRKAHMTAVHWGMLILAIHIGLHWKMLATFFRRIMHISDHSRFANLIMPGLFSIVALQGAYGLLNRDYLSYLLMAVDFSFFDYDESTALFYLRYLSIIILFSLATRFLLWWFIFRTRRPGASQ
ncbi:hypothetical protein C3432_11595 [Citrobacter amalonaticus]|uniref:Uncharacterized protein n=2 Tax=Citrobacter amalonaticus TaxID=35703 RepID=A0A2S4S0V1_CITAM|nr:hypothetical protein C3432_11595 [Citrobacter amalonaticus]POT78249.1 hypothetical protein C3436_00225 [Citrobacter amalonaticus]POU67085.1 hypothetical protein C3430_09795 [Citrobacter amalonaticus]POV06283.1 hypothetical protein C3424_07530 [Citrobacter amalonaticus]